MSEFDVGNAARQLLQQAGRWADEAQLAVREVPQAAEVLEETLEQAVKQIPKVLARAAANANGEVLLKAAERVGPGMGLRALTIAGAVSAPFMAIELGILAHEAAVRAGWIDPPDPTKGDRQRAIDVTQPMPGVLMSSSGWPMDSESARQCLANPNCVADQRARFGPVIRPPQFIEVQTKQEPEMPRDAARFRGQAALPHRADMAVPLLQASGSENPEKPGSAATPGAESNASDEKATNARSARRSAKGSPSLDDVKAYAEASATEMTLWRAARELRNKTRGETARRAGVSLEALRRLERGEGGSHDVRQRIAASHGLRPHELSDEDLKVWSRKSKSHVKTMSTELPLRLWNGDVLSLDIVRQNMKGKPINGWQAALQVLGLRQQEFSKITHLSQPSVSRLLRGKLQADHPTALAFAAAVGLRSQDLASSQTPRGNSGRPSEHEVPTLAQIKHYAATHHTATLWKAARELCGLTQRQAARKWGVSQPSLARVELGQSTSQDVRAKMAAGLNQKLHEMSPGDID